LQYVRLLHFVVSHCDNFTSPKWALTRLREFTGYLPDFRKVSPGATPEIGAALRIPALISSHTKDKLVEVGLEALAAQAMIDAQGPDFDSPLASSNRCPNRLLRVDHHA